MDRIKRRLKQPPGTAGGSFKKYISLLLLFGFAVLILLPLWMILTGSVMSAGEVKQHIGMIMGISDGEISWPVIPQFPTLKPYLELLFDSPNFFVMFWNSCLQVFSSVLLQLAVAVPAAWAFARFRFPGKGVLFGFYIVLMVLPFQVTMVPAYLVLKRIGVMDTHLAVILPNIFQTFPVFIMSKFFKAIPESLIEAAKLDGAGRFRVFLKIGLPMGIPGILSSFILNFIEYWNAIEQPLTFLREKALWPLSLYLSGITAENLGVSFAASVIAMLPPLLLFFAGQGYLEQGIAASGMKE